MRTEAYNILSNEDKDELLEIQGSLILGIQKRALSQVYKNTTYSGDIKAGSIEVNRFANATAKDYGTARRATKGDTLDNKGKVTVNVNIKKEIIEEVNKGDIDKIGIPGLIESRVSSHTNKMIANLDRAFFGEAEFAGTEIQLTGVDVESKIEEMIQSIETMENDYVDGINREDMVLFLNPRTYGLARNYIDTIQNANIDSDVEEIDVFHGVEVRSNHRQTKDIIAMVRGSIALPVNIYDYDLEKIGMSNDFALQLFYDYGVKAITPDLIKYASVVSVVEPTPVDKTALNTLIATVDLYEETDYSAGWSDFATSLAAAKVVSANDDATQAEVNAALLDLQTKVNALVLATNFTELNALIATAKAITQGDYTQASWDALQTAITAAETLAVDTTATQDDVDEGIIALQAAIDGLEE